MHMAPSIEPAAATPFLEVNGMVTPEVLMDDEEYNEVTHHQKSQRALIYCVTLTNSLDFDVLSRPHCSFGGSGFQGCIRTS